MARLMGPHMVQRQPMPFFDHNHALGNVIAQQVFQGPGHGRTGFAGPDHQDTVVIFKRKTVLPNLQPIIRSLYMAQNRFHRIHRLESSLKNFQGMLSQGLHLISSGCHVFLSCLYLMSVQRGQMTDFKKWNIEPF